MASWKTIFFLFVAFEIYLAIGMLGFHYLEFDNEDTVRRDTKSLKEQILANFTCLTSDDLEFLISSLSNAISNGIDPSKNVSSPSNWGFDSAYFFSGTVITTIGYGHISPSTKYGRSFCIVYALICGLLLSGLGEQLSKLKNKILKKINKSFKKKWQRKAVSILTLMGTGMALFIIFPALIFRAVEGWSYHDAWYYCFITLTTIGFGDFVPGQNPDIAYPTIYKIMSFYWIILGLVFVALIIQDISDAISSRVEKDEEEESEEKKVIGHSNFSVQEEVKMPKDAISPDPHENDVDFASYHGMPLAEPAGF